MTKDELREKVAETIYENKYFIGWKIESRELADLILAIEIERECPNCEGGYIYPNLTCREYEIAKICVKCQGAGKVKVKLGDLV